MLNPYIYCVNNPVNYVDPDGEWFFSFLLPGVGTIIDAALWNMTFYSVKAAINGNWNWGEFGKSAAVGLVSGAFGFGGSLLTNALNVTGALGGAAMGGLIGGVTGGLGGGITSEIMQKGSFWSGFGQGFLSSAFAGAISGGITGYQNAAQVGANKWTGELWSKETTIYTDNSRVYPNTPFMAEQDKHCYAHVAEYQTGTPYNDVIDMMGGSEGAGIGEVASKLNKTVVASEYYPSSSVLETSFGSRLKSGLRVDAAIPLQKTARTLGVTHHNVAVKSMTFASKWKIIGGGWGRMRMKSAEIWDPLRGNRDYSGRFAHIISYIVP